MASAADKEAEGSRTASRWRAPARLTTRSRPGCSSRIGAIAARSRRLARLRLDSAAGAGYREGDPRHGQLAGGEREPEPHPSVPRSRIPAPPQSGVARKGDAAGSSRRSRSQALAALPTACLEHLAPAGRRHAYAKPVRLTPVALLGLVRPLDGRLSETLIASGALWAPLSPTGLRREYTKAAVDRPSSVWSCAREITERWCARSACDRGCALLNSAGCSGSGKTFHTSHQAPRPPAAMHLSTDVHKLWITAL